VNLLITNVREDTAFLLIHYLKHRARRIVLAVDGERWSQRWTGMARYSRHVSASYRVPDPAADWWAGRIQASNTAAEENYVQQVEAICTRERIDVIFPSFDPEVYLFAKNSGRFAAAGVTVVTPPLDSVLRVQDKAQVLQAAAASGFPHPPTCYPATEADLEEVRRCIEPPWVLKPRLSAHGMHIEIAFDDRALVDAFRRMSAEQPAPLVQGYVPGGLKQNFYLVVDSDSRIVSAFSPRVTRVRREGVRTATAACVSTRQMPYLDAVQALVSRLGLSGGYTLQTQLDERDGSPRLMEINPRLGHNLWFRAELGLDEPAWLIRLARGESPGPAPLVAEDTLLLDPLIDLMHLLREVRHRLLAPLRRRAPQEGEQLPRDGARALLGAYRRDYLGPQRRVTSPLNRGYLDDPLPPLSRAARQLIALLKPDPGQLR
jgi:biotin carboxylase